MSTITVRGHEVFYVRRGQGPPMVLLHNGGTSHRIWEPLIEHYARTHDVVAIDLLGFGRSGRPRIEHSLELHVEVLDAVITQLALDDVTLVGTCMGAATAVRHADRRPERVRAVVAINLLTDTTAERGVLRPLIEVARRSRRATRLLAGLGARFRLPQRVAVAAVKRTMVSDPARVSPELLAHLGEASRDPDYLRVLLSLGADLGTWTPQRSPSAPPLCMVWGADNRVLPLRDGVDVRRRLAPEQDAVIPDAGHLVMLERPDEVIRVIDAFAARHAAHAAAPADG